MSKIAGFFGDQMDPDFLLAFGEDYQDVIPQNVLKKMIDRYMTDKSLWDNPEKLKALKEQLD